ncbi:MAG TPA: imidazole glycerol phosphate synthase subunit HisH [Terriglobales bacterium]|nr:imidazole glycerol phosphate synthase subunit HisH [Terriglobales bacterium]
MIALVDYGAGNVTSVRKALSAVGADATVTSNPNEIKAASKIIVPGVGHFAATEALSGLRPAITAAIAGGVPFLGICVGMQWMFTGSDESPTTSGLGLIDGNCTRFPSHVKAPHVGWNHLVQVHESRLLRNLPKEVFMYYTHSYRVSRVAECVATSDHGGEFAAAVEDDNVFGVQFHPEKSGELGLKILRNFLDVD